MWCGRGAGAWFCALAFSAVEIMPAHVRGEASSLASGANVHAEIGRGAAAVAPLIRKAYPYDKIHRLIRAAIERNTNRRRDSDGFLLGAHLLTAFWLDGLPSDIRWRSTALAHHRDLTGWLCAKVGLSCADIVRATAHAARFNTSAAQRLQRFCSTLCPRPGEPPSR